MDVDYRLAFDQAPIGLCVSRNRSIVDCNRQLCEMFGLSRNSSRKLPGDSTSIAFVKKVTKMMSGIAASIRLMRKVRIG